MMSMQSLSDSGVLVIPFFERSSARLTIKLLMVLIMAESIFFLS